MKHLITLILSVVLLTACGESERTDRLLRQAYAIADTKPDSALVMLKSICRDSLPNNELKYYHDLLTIKAKDKAYITHSSDSSILSVIAYYEKHPNDSLLPVAYYYGGRVYADLGDAPQALEYFQKALDCHQVSNQTLAVTHSQIAGIFHEQQVFNLAISAYKKAIDINYKQNNITNCIYNIRNLGNIYFQQDKTDSALILYNRALNVANKLSDTSLISSIKLQIANTLLYSGDYNDAYNILESIRSSLQHEDSIPITNAFAHLYYRLNNCDSTIYYCNKLIKSNSSEVKLSGYNILSNMYVKNHNVKDAYNALVMSTQLFDSVQKSTTPHKIRQLSSIYNYQIRERENHKLKQSIQAKEVKIILLTSSIVVVLIIAIFIILIMRKRKQMINIKLQNVELMLNQRNNLSEIIIAQNKEKISLLESQINSINSENKILIKELENQKKMLELNNERAILIKVQNDSAIISFNNDPFIKEIHNRLQSFHEGKNIITENEWLTLIERINQFFPDFINVLNNLPFKLSTYEFRVSILIKVQFTPREISLLTNHTDASVSMTRSRLHKKLTSTNGHANDWDKFIKSI